MAIFSKIDKEILVTLIIAIAVILLSGLMIYKNLAGPVAKVQNLIGGVQTQIK